MFIKIRFVSPDNGATAGLVVDATAHKTIEEYSRLFPVWEAPKMRHFQSSPYFNNWNDAFHYRF